MSLFGKRAFLKGTHTFTTAEGDGVTIVMTQVAEKTRNSEMLPRCISGKVSVPFTSGEGVRPLQGASWKGAVP